MILLFTVLFAGCVERDLNKNFNQYSPKELIPDLEDRFVSINMPAVDSTNMFLDSENKEIVGFDVFICKTEDEAISLQNKYTDDMIRVESLSGGTEVKKFWGIFENNATVLRRYDNVVGIVYASYENDNVVQQNIKLANQKSQLMVDHWKSLDP